MIGLGASAERPPRESAGAQFTAYIDRRWRLGENWAAQIGVVHYDSPWNAWSNEVRYNELNAAIGFRGRWRWAIALSPDTTAVDGLWTVRKGFAANTEITFHQPLGGRLAADIGLGYANRERISGGRHAYGNAGLSYAIEDFYIYSSVVWTTSRTFSYTAAPDPGARWVNSLAWSF